MPRKSVNPRGFLPAATEWFAAISRPRAVRHFAVAQINRLHSPAILAGRRARMARLSRVSLRSRGHGSLLANSVRRRSDLKPMPANGQAVVKIQTCLVVRPRAVERRVRSRQQLLGRL